MCQHMVHAAGDVQTLMIMCRHMVYAAGDVQILCITHLSLTQTVTAHETAMEMLVEFPLRVYV